MEHKLYGIFPTPVMKFKLDREFTNKELEFFEFCRKDTNPNIGNTVSVNTECLDDSCMVEIKEFCNNALNVYLKEIYCPKYPNHIKLKVTQSWLNYSRVNEFHHNHYHPNSIVSGVLYINADKELDEIVFTKHGSPRPLEIISAGLNDYNTYETTFKVGKYELILFPSELYHRVPNTKNRDVRISLAFNSFFEGKLGDKPFLNYLEL